MRQSIAVRLRVELHQAWLSLRDLLKIGEAVNLLNESVGFVAFVAAIVLEKLCVVQCFLEVTTLFVPFCEEEKGLHRLRVLDTLVFTSLKVFLEANRRFLHITHLRIEPCQFMQSNRFFIFDTLNSFSALNRLRLLAHLFIALSHSRPHSRIKRL